MKTRNVVLSLALAVAGVSAASQALADPEAILKKDGCLRCHSWDKAKVGPAYNDVAKKYKGQAGAVDKLVAEITAGKPPHPTIKATPEEAKEAITYILSK
ncbi:MAG TPA: c-type cytochrome [Usitatibacter sp.]|nr:c-type cytochrome [Usitatibacter sp.]